MELIDYQQKEKLKSILDKYLITEKTVSNLCSIDNIEDLNTLQYNLLLMIIEKVKEKGEIKL